jgi:hypothetical protein
VSSVQAAVSGTHVETILPDIFHSALVLRLRLLPAPSRVLHAAGDCKSSLHAGQVHYLGATSDSDSKSLDNDSLASAALVSAPTRPPEAASSTRTST